MIWSRYWVLAPWAGFLLVLSLTWSISGLVDYKGRSTQAPAYQLEKLFPELGGSQRVGAEAAPGQPDARDPGSSSRFAPIVAEKRAALGWALAALVLALALLVALVVPWVLAHQALEELGARRIQVLAALAVVAGAAGIITWQGDAKVLPHLLQALVDDLDGSSVSRSVKSYREATKGLSVAAILGLIFAFSATLLPGDRGAGHVAAQARRLRIGLYVAAGLLVAGLLEVTLLLHWPSARLPGEDAAAIRELADTVSIAGGTLLSLLLVATYGPASLVLLGRAHSLAQSEAPEKRKAWLAEAGLVSLPSELLLRVLALLAPLIAGGPVTSLIESLGS